MCRNNDLTEFGCIILDCHSFLQQNPYFDVFTRKEANKVVHVLVWQSHYVYLMDLFNIPEILLAPLKAICFYDH